MPDYRKMMSSDRLRAVDLDEKPRVVTIARVTQGTYAPNENQKKPKRMPDIHFREFEVPLGANSTNCKAIAKLLGSKNTDDWIGRSIELYPTTTEAWGETKDCIRVSNRLPQADRGPQRRAPAQQRPQQPPARGTAPPARSESPPPPPPAEPSPPPPDDDELALIAARDREDAPR